LAGKNTVRDYPSPEKNVSRPRFPQKGFATLPGIKLSTSSSDYRVNKQLQMEKFNGERWELFGPILEDTATAG
jgi:branched-chain amino acid transport system substrate-binding protein